MATMQAITRQLKQVQRRYGHNVNKNITASTSTYKKLPNNNIVATANARKIWSAESGQHSRQ
jgi:hypothetical protein